ncbi:MAG: DUF6273 domain-containing protein, partial [Spirochaetaceae bacterium]|nr:DUF6273 domain-containing protein [Spirochaetaceae bacterium]
GKLGFGPEEEALNGRIPAVFESLGAKDTSKTTTQLTLVFDRDIEGLSADDITVDAGTTGAKKGGLAKAGLGTYSLALDGVTAVGTIAVSVARDGYLVSPSTQKAQAFFVNPVIAVEFISAVANGVLNTESTTALTLTFNQAIEGLSADDIAVEGDGFTKGALNPAGGLGVYTLALSEVTAQSEITVSAGKDGYKISDPSHEVTVSYPLKLTSVEANGEEGVQTTDQLTLTFDRDIAWSVPVSITVTGTGLSAGTPSKTDDPKIYTLPVLGVTKGETVNVSVNWTGYAPVSKQVTVVYHRALGTLVEADKNDPSIKKKFGVTTGGAKGVEDTFKELFAFIKNNGLTANSGVVKTGDYIDLEGGLTVTAYNSGGGAINFSQDQAASTEAGAAPNSTPLLRLIVVGINSFNKTNPNSPQHVVFQFLHLPVKRRMHSTSSAMYSATEMSSYLEGNFYTGLKNAGVPEDVVWAPNRNLATSYNGTVTEIQKYNVWLPTARELLGADTTANADANKCAPETTTNQAKLEYYQTKNSRKKALNVSESYAYWTASPVTTTNFMSITGNGSVKNDNINTSVLGIAPAFCVGPGN